MCHNQYFDTGREKICRMFIVSDSQGNELKRFQINIAQFLESFKVNISQIFELMASKGLSLSRRQFYIPMLNLLYREGSGNILTSLHNLNERSIQIFQQQICDNQQLCQQVEEAEPVKRQKEPERVIRSVIEHVKLWRYMHTKNRKLSLTEAAKLIGVSKKTLDDYFLQLRLGELYGFDFKENLDSKIGVLRSHIRRNEVKELESRLPKEIKCFKYVKDIEELEEQLLPNKQQQNVSYNNTSEHEDNFEDNTDLVLTFKNLLE